MPPRVVSQAKILQYETFLNEQLKPDLNNVLQERDKLYGDIAELLALKASIAAIQSAGLKTGEPLPSKVDLGCNFYVKAKIDDPSKIFVDVGLGFFLELTLEEAVKFVEKKVGVLEDRAKGLTEESCKIKANIKLTLEGLRELQNLANEDLIKKRNSRKSDPLFM